MRTAPFSKKLIVLLCSHSGRRLRFLSSLAPHLRGEGWGEGLPPRGESIDRPVPPHPDREERSDLSPQAGRGKKTSALRRLADLVLRLRIEIAGFMPLVQLACRIA